MSVVPLTQDQTDTLQEIVNIAMGQAGDSLARILDTFVELSVPRIRLVSAQELIPTIKTLISGNQQTSAVRQAFFDSSRLRGEAVVIFGEKGCSELADLMGYAGDLNNEAREELLLEVSNVLVGACLNGIGQQLHLDLSYSAPSIMIENQPVERIVIPEDLAWSIALLVEVNFGLENRDFKSHLLMLAAEDSITVLRNTLDEFLESM